MFEDWPRKYLPPGVYHEKHGNWSWGGAIAGAVAVVGFDFLVHHGLEELTWPWGTAAVLCCFLGYIAGELAFESTYFTNDD